MPPPIPSSAHQVFTTEEIVAQPAGFIREIIRALCADDAVRTRASILLSKLQDGGQIGQAQLQSVGDIHLNSRSHTASPTPASKTPPSRSHLRTCVQCEMEFQEEDNTHKGVCQYHDGRLYIDHKYWRDWNHNDGPIDTPDNRHRDPEGFRWSCCDATYNTEGHGGCISGFHRAAVPKETHHLEEAEDGAPSGKRPKLGDEMDTTQDAITGASGAAIITGTSRASTSGTPQKTKPVEPKTLPEGMKICVKCKEEYWEDKNWPRSCWFHDGYLDLNPLHEVWELMDYDDEAEIDTEEMREEVPQGFTYLCCGETGLSKGCKWGTHSSTEDPSVAKQQVLEVNHLTNSNLEESSSPNIPTGDDEVEGEEEAEKTKLDDKIYAWMNH